MMEILIRTSVLFIIVGVASFALRRRTAALKHALWACAIVGAVLLPALTRVAPFQWRILPASAPAVAAQLIPIVSSNAESSKRESPAVQEARRDAVVDQPGAPATVRTAFSGMDAAKALAALYLIGVIVLLARLVAGMVAVHRIAGRATEITDSAWRSLADRAILALGLRVPVEIRRSDEVAMPFATGLLYPVIVLPSVTGSWNAQQREAVLLHELAHISRGDLAMNLLSHVMRAAYWMNPLAWLAAHRLRVEGEKACDDAVILGGARPSEYADHLLSIVRTVGNTVPNVALAMARRSDFEGRLLAILEPGVRRGRLTRTRTVAIAVLFVAAVMPLAAMTPVVSPVPADGDMKAALQTATPSATRRQPNTTPLPQATAPVAALAGALADANVNVRLAAVQSLGNLQDPAAIAALAKALKEDTDARVREAAAWSLGEIDDNRAVPHLLEALKTEKVAKVREKIVGALREIDDPSAAPGIVAVLKDPSADVRRTAVEALEELEDANSLSPLMTMVRDDDLEVRRRVASALGRFENPVVIDALIALTHDADHEVRSNAIESLDHFDDQRTVAPLTAALADKNADVRSHAADALGSIENMKSAPRALIDALSDPDRDVRRSAASSLGNIGDEAAVPGLKRLLSDSDVETRRHAVEALKEIGGADAIQALMGLLKDQDPEIRKTAAEALGKRRGG